MEEQRQSLAKQIDWRGAEVERQTPIDFDFGLNLNLNSFMVCHLVGELRLKRIYELLA